MRPHWVSYSLLQLYFRASFFKALGIHFSRESKERYALAVGAFTLVSLFVYMEVTLLCQPSGVLPEHQAT